MRRWLAWVLKWLFPPECLIQPLTPNPSPTRGEGRKGDGQPLWVDAGLVGMKREVGVEFQVYPTIVQISGRLNITDEDAEWVWHACNFSDRVWALVTINDVARALLDGIPITEIRERGFKTMMQPAVWERK